MTNATSFTLVELSLEKMPLILCLLTEILSNLHIASWVEEN